MLTWYLIFGLLSAFGAFLVIYNLRVTFLWLRARHQVNPSTSSESLAPLLGGLFIALSLLALPLKVHWIAIVLPLVLDPGSAPLIGTTIYYHWKDWRAKKRADKLVAPED